SGIAGRIDDVGVEIDVAEKPVAREGGCSRRRALDGSEPVGAGKHGSGLDRSEELPEPALRLGRREKGEENDRREQETPRYSERQRLDGSRALVPARPCVKRFRDGAPSTSPASSFAF